MAKSRDPETEAAATAPLRQPENKSDATKERIGKENIDKAKEDPTRSPRETALYEEEQRRREEATGEEVPPVDTSGPIRAPGQNPPLNQPFGDEATQPLDEDEQKQAEASENAEIDPDVAARKANRDK